MQPQKNSTRYKKSIKVVTWLAFVALLCALAAATAYFLLPVDKILEQQFKAWLKEKGIEAEFSVSALTTRHLMIDNASLSGSNSPRFNTLRATYSMASLRNRQVDTLEVSGLWVSVNKTQNGTLEIAGMPPILAGTANAKTGAPLPTLPFNTLSAKDVQLVYMAEGKMLASLSANMILHRDYTGEVHITQASLPLEDGEISLHNLKLARTKPDNPFTVTLENISHITNNKAYFTPLTAAGEISLSRDNHHVSSIITINDLRKLWTLTITGDAQLDAGIWNIHFEQPVMEFESGIIQPDMLFPVLRGAVTQASGSFSLKGSATKTADAPLQSEGVVTFYAMAATVKDIPVKGINGTMTLSSLYPPVTKGKQTLDVQEIMLGLPLKNGRVVFALDKEGAMTFMPSTWEWAEGHLHTAGASMNIHNPALPDITLSANGLALEKLLSGLLKQGISATGKLSGVIPVHFTKEGNAMIREGKLETDAGGIVRYNPTEDSPLQKGSSFQTDILLSAMENFHYEELTMTINSKDAQELEVLLHVKGRNPELYDGQTVELNINLTGNLLDIVQSGMDVYTLPERLQEQLMQ